MFRVSSSMNQDTRLPNVTASEEIFYDMFTCIKHSSRIDKCGKSFEYDITF